MSQQVTERQIVRSIDVAASPERVFRALTEPAELRAWWGDPTSHPSLHWEVDLRPSGKWLSRWKNLAQGNEYELGGEVLEVRARVRVTHTGFEGTRPDFDDYNPGWSMVLAKLRTHTGVAA